MDNLIQHQRDVVARHIQGENEGDWEKVYDTFVQNERAHYDVVPLGTSFKGIDGVRAFYESIATAIPDFHIEVNNEFDVAGCCIRECVITGTHKGEFMGIPPLGNPIRVDLAAFYTFDPESGKLISERIYYDQASVMQQMTQRQTEAVA